MTDRLKLSDPTGDAEVDKIAVAAEQEDRIQQLRKNIAALQSTLAKQTANAATSPAPAANNKIGARKHGSFKAISTAPSINWTPHGPTMVPVPYPVVQDLTSSVNTASTVKFNGCPVYLLDASTQPKCTGDERGTGKGIKSGTVSGEVKPVQGSSTVRVEGKRVVREGDACTMNGGNCPGIYVTTPPTSGTPPKDAIKNSNPDAAKNAGPISIHPSSAGDGVKVAARAITPEQIALLQKGDFLGFWRSRYWNSNDPVARTALIGWGSPESVVSPQPYERISAAFTWTVLQEYLHQVNHVGNVSKEMQKIGLELARAHAAAVTKDIAERRGVPGALSAEQVAAYHWKVFKSHDVPTGVFGGTLLGLPATTYSGIWCDGCDNK